MSVSNSISFLRDIFSRIREEHGLLRTIAFSPFIILIGAFLYDVVNDTPSDTEKVEAAKQRSAQIDDWSELVNNDQEGVGDA